MTKGCWSDNTLLPGACVLDSGDEVEIYGCFHARDGGITDKRSCSHWDEELALQLAKEIVGDGYAIEKRIPEINNPCEYTDKHCTHFARCA